MLAPAPALRRAKASGFTLVEILVATAILSLIIVLFATLLSQTSAIWRRTTGKMEQFRESRGAFERMTTRLSQATLNTYWDYDNPAAPSRYERRSELRFIAGPASSLLPTTGSKTRLTHAVFFQSPVGYTANSQYQSYDNLLSVGGYYLEFASDQDLRPSFVTPAMAPLRYRHRLIEFLAPTEKNLIYQYTSPPNGVPTYTGKEWYQSLANQNPSPGTPANNHAIAENIVALVITPRLSQQDEAEVKGTSTAEGSPLAPNYLYDSAPGATTDSRYNDGRLNPTNQLPPILQVTMVAIDEASAIRLAFGTNSANIFGVANKFTKSADYSKDLLQSRDANSLEATLIAKGVNYRIFNTNVIIRGAKWSREQKN